MKPLFAFVLWMLPLLWLQGCTEDAMPERTDYVISFEHKVGSAPLVLGNTYSTAQGQAFTVQDFRYYVSNLVLENSKTGRRHVVPNSYHLIVDDGNGGGEIRLMGVPTDAYDTFRFSWGIDPVKNTSLDNSGDLDPSNEMAWNWNTGYKFILLEGRLQPSARGLVYHIGFDHNYKEFALSLPSDAGLDRKTVVGVLFEVNLLHMFSGRHVIDITTHNNVMGGPVADQIAQNIHDGLFRLKEVR